MIGYCFKLPFLATVFGIASDSLSLSLYLTNFIMAASLANALLEAPNWLNARVCPNKCNWLSSFQIIKWPLSFA